MLCRVVRVIIQCPSFVPKPNFLSTNYRSMSDSSSTTKSKTDVSTLNQEEVDKFRRMAHDWWDPKGPAQGLLSMNQLRVPLIKDGLVNSKFNIETKNIKQFLIV